MQNLIPSSGLCISLGYRRSQESTDYFILTVTLKICSRGRYKPSVFRPLVSFLKVKDAVTSVIRLTVMAEIIFKALNDVNIRGSSSINFVKSNKDITNTKCLLISNVGSFKRVHSDPCVWFEKLNFHV